MQLRFLTLFIIFNVLSIRLFAQGTENFMPNIPTSNFGNDSLIEYTFSDYNEFINLNKDSTFLFSKCFEDTVCGCLCITGKWTILSTRQQQKRNFIQALFGKKRYNTDSLALKLTEEKRTRVYPTLPWVVSDYNKYIKPFNDTLVIYFYSENSRRVKYGYYRKSPWWYLDPSPEFFKSTRRLPPTSSPFDPDNHSDLTNHLEKKYNIIIDYNLKRHRPMRYKYSSIIHLDYTRLLRSYNYFISQKGIFLCNCFDSSNK